MKIEINQQQCLKGRFTKAECRACRDICPAGAISEELKADNRCSNCGLCLAACPVDAVAGAGYSGQTLQRLIAKTEPIRLICQKCQPDSLWPCLGFLDTVLLLAFVYSGKDNSREVALYREECETCRSGVARHLEHILQETNRLLAPQHKQVAVSREKFGGIDPAKISRRQFFGELWGASVSTVRVVAFPDSGNPDPIHRRELFLTHNGAALTAGSLGRQSTFHTIAVADSCNACGMCAKVCVAGALTTAVANNVLQIKHNPAICRNCGICAGQCPQGAISHMPAETLQETAVQVPMPVCAECGQAYQPIGSITGCIDCLQRRKFLL